jgi:hypothetical protein
VQLSVPFGGPLKGGAEATVSYMATTNGPSGSGT